MSTHVFNVSGDKPAILTQTLMLAMKCGKGSVRGWYVSPKDGLVLCWHKPSSAVEYSAFPAPMTAEFLGPMASAWLESDFALRMDLPEEDQGYSGGDGDNVRGWRVHLPGDFYAVCAVKPSHCYYGK